MKKAAAVMAALALAVTLAGCASGPDIERDSSEIGSGYSLKEVALPDGRELTCLFWHYGKQSATMSCDWAGAK